MAALLALCGRRRPLPLLPVLLLGAVSSIRTTDAALVPRTSATLPDLRTPHALLGVIALCISVPIYVVSIVLLWRRRGFFPIAGRGFVYLITLAVVVLIAQIEMIGVLVAYPQGIPWSDKQRTAKQRQSAWAQWTGLAPAGILIRSSAHSFCCSAAM